MTDKQPELWDVNDAFEDDLRWNDPEEAVSEYLIEGYVEEDADGNEKLNADAPETVTLTGWVRETVDVERELRGNCVLEYLLERLDDDYGGEEPTEPTDEMKAAERAFVEAVVSHYWSWRCNKVTTETVKVREWCAEHEPGWLK